MGIIKRSLYISCLCAAMLVLLAVVAWREQYYLPLSLLMIILAMLPFYIRFERRKLRAEEILLIAMLGAIAAISRVPFSAIPNVQPTSFVVIMSALVFGAETGFLVGSIAALASNLLLGQGPWTPWQMFGWGIMGFTAGMLKETRFMNSLWGKNAFGFVWGFVFGWIMNVWSVLGFLGQLSWAAIAAAYAASFYFDLAHALCNVFFITAFSAIWMKILLRVKMKYGLLKPD